METAILMSDRLLKEALDNREIKFWEDPGHGWMQVPIGLINAAKKEKGLKVSGYSYKNKDYGFLEEDCDAPAFMNCFPEYNFRDLFLNCIITSEHRENIFIRNLNRF